MGEVVAFRRPVRKGDKVRLNADGFEWTAKIGDVEQAEALAACEYEAETDVTKGDERYALIALAAGLPLTVAQAMAKFDWVELRITKAPDNNKYGLEVGGGISLPAHHVSVVQDFTPPSSLDA